MRPIFHAAAVLAAGCALAAPVAFGQAAKPEPGCAPVNPDKKGDVDIANLDITGFWFKFEGGKTTANMRIANLDRSIPSDATAINWFVLWNFDGAQRFVQTSIDVGVDDEPTFTSGTVEIAPSGNPIRRGGVETTGQFIEGPDGVISVEIPAELGGEKGRELKPTSADTQFSRGIPGVASSLVTVDEASGKPYTVGACEEAGPKPPPTTTTPPPTTTTPPPSTSGPAPQGRVVAAEKLDAKVSKKMPKAKKVKRSLTLSLKSKGGITNVDAGLFKGALNKNKVVAKGKLSSAKGKARLKLKVSKKLKKGSYTLYLVGNNADGTTADRTFKLKFK